MRDGGEEGERSFYIGKDNIAFSIRVANQALVLAEAGGESGKGQVKVMSIPKTNLVEALDCFTGKMKAGEFDARLNVLPDKRETRVTAT